MVAAEILSQLINIVGAQYVSTANDVIVANSQDALKQAHEAIELWLDTAREFGDAIP